MSKPNLPQDIPQGGGSFLRQPDGGLKQIEKPTAEPTHKPAKPAKPATKETK